MIQKVRQARPLSKQLFLIQRAAHGPVSGLVNKEEIAGRLKHHSQSSPNFPTGGPRRASPLNYSELFCRNNCRPKSQVMEVGSKPTDSNQRYFQLCRKSLTVPIKHLARMATGCRNSGVSFQSRRGMTNVRRHQGPGRDPWLRTPHPGNWGPGPSAVEAAILFSSQTLTTGIFFSPFLTDPQRAELAMLEVSLCLNSSLLAKH